MASSVQIRELVALHSYSIVLADQNEAWRYLEKLSVEDVTGDGRRGFLIRFYFYGHPVLRNQVLTKEYIVVAYGDLLLKETASGTIRWPPGRQPPAVNLEDKTGQRMGNGYVHRSFLDWFTDGPTSRIDQVLQMLDYYFPFLIEAERRRYENAEEDLDLTFMTDDEENDSGIGLDDEYEMNSDSE
ncbi:protein SET-like [Toxorhynchites rutilus septentrionalis]|uniref:protein SET-like n=1 Tax=Toxorhynchites rutilus septentrionalis TaxID=329112 RepID=UPI00247A768D|nr:protein SET-like [Toxorhynchites rutilus septentrionalis]